MQFIVFRIETHVNKYRSELVRIGCSQVLSNSLNPGEVTKEEVHYLKDKGTHKGTHKGPKGHQSRFH